jgi:hypothetical protein
MKISILKYITPYSPLKAQLDFYLIFDPEYGGKMFFRNVCLLSTGYMVLHPRRQNCDASTHMLHTSSSGKTKYRKCFACLLPQPFKITKYPGRNIELLNHVIYPFPKTKPNVFCVFDKADTVENMTSKLKGTTL